MKKPIEESELILNPDGSVYHLNLKPEDLADRIFFVGDPDRVEQVSKHFDSIEKKIRKREFYTITGYLGKQRLSVMSTGIGTDNIDIVWNELDALVNIDFATRQIRATHKKLHVLRLGTCGGLDPEVPVGSLVNSQYAIGGDGLMHYYDTSTYSDAAFLKALNSFQKSQLPHMSSFYAAKGAESIIPLIREKFPNILQGITFTAAGFYGPQGRNLGRLQLKTEDFVDQLRTFRFENISVLNMEMETAGILGLGRGLGHGAASLSVILANRSRGEFHQDPKKAIEGLIEQGLEIMLGWEAGESAE